MKNFLKYLLATVVGIIISSVILFFILMGIAGVIISKQDKPAEIRSNSILYLKLDVPIQERKPSFPLIEHLFNGFKPDKILGLNEIIENLEKASKDENIKGVYLESPYIRTGLSSTLEIRNALLKFKESGKFVISYNEMYDQKSYFLASAADKIYLNPEGGLLFKGLQAQVMFFKGTLDKLNIEAQVLRHGKYKSAVEPFMYTEMSKENSIQLKDMINTMWDFILDEIAQSRKIKKSKLNKIADNLLIKDPEAALNYNLIDGIKYEDEVWEELMELSELSGKKQPRLVSLGKYSKVPKKRAHKGLAKNKIAVIFAYGTVQSGDDGEGSISSERISKAIRKARKDSAIKAIVFRINSGGGSSLASEVIWRELYLAQQVKPVIASMGDVAASGAYYIASTADTILCSPTTITGSIGVWGLLFYMGPFFDNKLGITLDVEKTNSYADFGNFFRRLKPLEKERLEYMIDKVYGTFVAHVAEGRNMTIEEVDEIGQGRIWSGIRSQEKGLTDLHGGLQDAVQIAAKKASVDRYRIVELPRLEDPLEYILKDLTDEISFYMKKNNKAQKYLDYIEELEKLNGVQTRLPYQIELE